MEKFYTYILYSISKNKYYVGQTIDIQKRIFEHNITKNLGVNDWVLKYFESFNSRAEAVRREVEIKKKKSRFYIEKLISSKD